MMTSREATKNDRFGRGRFHGCPLAARRGEPRFTRQHFARAFQGAELGYPYDVLEPYIDAETMQSTMISIAPLM